MRILLVDDEKQTRGSITRFLRLALDHDVVESDNALDALKKFKVNPFPLVITDIRMPKMSGLDLLQEIKKLPSGRDTGVILITGFSDLESAVLALREGAFDYLNKPADIVELANVISRFHAKFDASFFSQDELQINGAGDAQKSVQATPSELNLKSNLYINVDGIGDVGVFSEDFRTAIVLASRFHDDRSIPVLIEGETGTGKEIIARLVHNGQNSSGRPFVSINCSAIAPSLFESELFGYESGAFTNARKTGMTGKLEAADGGSIFFDEIGDVPLDMQPKLLRAIQEKEIYKVGGANLLNLDVRIIAATNCNLIEKVNQGLFRADLYYRLNLGHIVLSPLRKQQEAIIPLAQMFLDKYSKKLNRRFRFISKDAMKFMYNYKWTGNIRELKNVIERIVLLYNEYELSREYLAFLERGDNAGMPSMGRILELNRIVLPEDSLPLPDLETEIIRKTMMKFKDNQSQAARYLGISRYVLRNKLKKMFN